MLRYSTDFAAQLALQQLVLSQLQTNFSNVVAAAADLNDTAASTAVEAAQLAFDLFANITGDVLTTLTVRFAHTCHCNLDRTELVMRQRSRSWPSTCARTSLRTC